MYINFRVESPQKPCKETVGSTSSSYGKQIWVNKILHHDESRLSSLKRLVNCNRYFNVITEEEIDDNKDV